ncbi:TetR/AcrR family transcriptional regulator [Pseudocolwellia agarivorans]|uniref:TetR/AcrR family transcriptional regulator n=1 Tax=Pseudocolwellia agarivorans TaxID=1911682 RepID=UPI00098722F6|nr:TetR/AcrR family transcriptional regulator [Pseudocolwellia agarivorans]
MSKTSTYVSIIKAAENVIKEKGLAKLTLQLVAETAGISKGGLLYHFPSKNALIEGMLEYSLTTFEKFIEQYTKDDIEPGSWARGFILGTFSASGSLTEEVTSAAALVASSGLNPSLMKPYIEMQKKWLPALLLDGLDKQTALIIRMGVDGLWLNEALGVQALGKEERQSYIDYLITLTRVSQP